MTDEQVQAFRLVDNKVGEFSWFDINKLQQELEKIDFDMTLFGFSIGEDVLTDDVECEDVARMEVVICPKCGESFEVGK